MALAWTETPALSGWRDVRVALGSVAATPIRAIATETRHRGPLADPGDRRPAPPRPWPAEIKPIDDVRSTADYRRIVVGADPPSAHPRGRRLVSDDVVLDAPTDEAYVAALAPLFEGAPRFLARVAAARPVRAVEAFFSTGPGDRPRHARGRADRAPRRAPTPRRPARHGVRDVATWSRATTSDVEAEAIADPVDVAAELERLNARLRSAVRVPLLCLRGRPDARGLLPDMAAAIGEERDAELHRALDAVVDIATDRLATLDRTNGETT